MFQVLAKVSCGNIMDIPSKLPKLTSEVFLLLEIAIPVLLVIMGTLDLFRSITSNKEDEMAKGRKMFFKRLITAAIVFFIIAITKLIISFLDSDNSTTLIDCMDCFISNECTINNSTSTKNEEPVNTNKQEPTRNETNKTNTQDSYYQQQDYTKIDNDNTNTNTNTNNDEIINIGDGGVIDNQRLDKESGSFTKNYSNVDYYLYVPANATKGMPLVIFLHGIGEKGNMSAVKNLRPVTIITDGTLLGLENFIFLAPTSPRNLHWGEQATWDNLIKLIDYITNEYSINSSRIYLTGFSAGGMGVWSLVNKYPNKFRAAVAVSGNIYNYNANNFKYTPIYAIVGDRENTFIGPMQDMVNSINNAGGNAKFKMIPNANHIITQNSYSTKELYQWLLSQ